MKQIGMLASDSDSDFEYSNRAAKKKTTRTRDESDSDGSDDIALQKLALGVDSNDLKNYDVRASPKNGSQYLMKVMAETRTVPKVVCADTSKLPLVAVVARTCAKKEPESINPNYLERFLQMCTAYEEGKEILQNVNTKLLPSSKWRKETIATFSNTRTGVDRRRHAYESGEIFIQKSVKIPQNNNSEHWMKFCFGQPFIELASISKLKNPDEKLHDFFLDLYDPLVSFRDTRTYDESEADRGIVQNSTRGTSAIPNSAIAGNTTNQSLKSKSGGTDSLINSKPDVHGDGNEKDSSTVDPSSSGNDGDTGTSETESDNVPETPDPVKKSTTVKKDLSTFVFGHHPLMNLVMQFNQAHLDNLVKYNLLWLKTYGFVNECQGQWLYAVLACLGKPIDPSVMSDLRSVARILITLRNSITQWNDFFHFQDQIQNSDTQTCSDSKEDKLDEKIFDFINTLNLLIYIIADYFQQKDLIEHL